MASPTPAPERHQWTDEYKRATFAEFDALPIGEGRKQWLKERGFAPPHFYRMRKAFQGSKPAPKKAIKRKKRHLSPAGIEAIKEAQRRRWAVAKAAGTGKYTTMTGKVSKGSFKAADQETKYRLVREYDALPEEGKAAWRKAHGGVDTALITYHRSRMLKKAPTESKAVVPYNHGQKIPTEKLPAILAEYDAVHGANGAKQKWLDQHGLNYSNIHEMRKKLAHQQNQPQPHPTQQKPTPAAQPQFIPAATPGPVITLDDAIAALQVRQDIWQEFMGLLKAMARGR